MTKLIGLQFKIVYKCGKENVATDALSRIGFVTNMASVTEVQPVWVQEVLISYVTNSMAQLMMQRFAIRSPDEEGYFLQQGLIRKGQHIWVGKNLALRTKLISAFHESALGGQSGMSATFQHIKKLFCWRGMKAEGEMFVRQCLVCQ